MSISVISAPASSTPLTPTTSATGNGDSAASASGQDFISLLFGQLLAAAPVIPSVSTPAAPVSNEKTADADKEAKEDDASVLLASLAIPIPGAESNVIPAVTPSVMPQPQVIADDMPADKTSAQTSTTLDHALVASDKAMLARTEAAPTGNALHGDTGSQESDPNAAKFAVPSAVVAPKEPLVSAQKESPATVSPATAEQPSAPVVLPLNSPAVPAGRETPASLAIPANLHDQRWNTDFSQKIVWLATQQKQSAELTLNPPHLGNIEVSVRIDNSTQTATASFVSAHADVRESIEAALPRLREMFAHAGISLGQTNVSAESFRQAGSQWDGSGSSPRWHDDNAILEPDPATLRTGHTLISRGNGLVDTFV